MLCLSPDYQTRVMRVTDASGRKPQITAEEAAELQRARERMIARHKLIDGMIRNNEMQLKNESARGGAEIELECAMRDMARPGAGTEAQAELERATARLQALREVRLGDRLSHEVLDKREANRTRACAIPAAGIE